ncbi:MAG: hypothetical protein H5T86_16830, partial [Armatimonadetes bacterium]|nr:hypothetical protein [Armatimonadota bacterium]
FLNTLTRQAHVFMRAPGQDEWQRLTVEPVACSITALSAREREVMWARLSTAVTHRGRCLPRPEVQAGRKLVVADEAGGAGETFIIVAVRRVSHPAPAGHLVLDLAAVDAAE